MDERIGEKINLESHNPEFVCIHLDTIKELQQKSAYSDVEIIIDYKVVKAHKVILSRSPTFHKLFTSMPDLKEINLSDEISDSVESDIQNLFGDHDLDKERKDDLLKFSSRACQTFLRYLYATKIEKKDINLDLILVAQKFSDEKLKKFCETHLLENTNLRNVIRTLLVSLVTGCEKMKNQACEIIARNFCEIKFNKDFQLVLENENALSAILDVFKKCQVTLLTTLKKENDKELEKKQFLCDADLLIIVEDHHFLVNKEILSERNAVFKEIINAASVDGFPTSVKIPDVDQKTFKIFLQYIYTEKVESNAVNKKLLEVAHKYTHDGLKDFCENEFLQKLNHENVIDSLITSIEFECEKLKSHAANFTVVRYDTMKKHKDYQKLLQNPKAANMIIEILHNKIPKTSEQFFIGKFFFKFSTIEINAYVLSDTFKVKNHLLRIHLGRTVDKKRLSIYLMDINSKSSSESHSEYTCFSLKLISVNEKHSIAKNIFHDFKIRYYSGFEEFLPWSVLEDPEYGYIKDEKITIEVDVTAV